jgi:hypothetical protein
MYPFYSYICNGDDLAAISGVLQNIVQDTTPGAHLVAGPARKDDFPQALFAKFQTWRYSPRASGIMLSLTLRFQC